MKRDTRFTTSLGTALALVTTMSACTPRSNSWTEEVELSSGEVVIVERHEKYHSNRELSGYNNVWIESSKVSVKTSSTAPVPPSLTANEFLIRLDFDLAKQQWYAIGFVEDCYRAQREGLGTRPYHEYILASGTWSRRPVSPEHVGATSNLLISKKLAEEAPAVKLDEKKRADSSVSRPDYLKRVLDKVAC
jgi:hypothetical protein